MNHKPKVMPSRFQHFSVLGSQILIPFIPRALTTVARAAGKKL